MNCSLAAVYYTAGVQNVFDMIVAKGGRATVGEYCANNGCFVNFIRTATCSSDLIMTLLEKPYE